MANASALIRQLTPPATYPRGAVMSALERLSIRQRECGRHGAVDAVSNCLGPVSGRINIRAAPHFSRPALCVINVEDGLLVRRRPRRVLAIPANHRVSSNEQAMNSDYPTAASP